MTRMTYSPCSKPQLSSLPYCVQLYKLKVFGLCVDGDMGTQEYIRDCWIQLGSLLNYSEETLSESNMGVLRSCTVANIHFFFFTNITHAPEQHTWPSIVGILK
jgi:hypothetical protein